MKIKNQCKIIFVSEILSLHQAHQRWLGRIKAGKAADWYMSIRLSITGGDKTYSFTKPFDFNRFVNQKSVQPPFESIEFANAHSAMN